MSEVIQNLVMPNLVFGAPEELYVRLHSDNAHVLLSEGRLLFDVGGRASFDTFFNSLTIAAWKTLSALDDLQLHLRGEGHFIVRLGLHRIGHAQRWLAEHLVTLAPDQDVVIEVAAWQGLESGMLYFAVEALTPGTLVSGHFATRTHPKRDVKLGIVITHFNRKQWVLPAIARIRNELLNDPLYREHIELVVVDNSQNISEEEAHGVTLIPNRNFGGAGGFTRGLLYLKDQKSFSHCLFMDDDASCETESIRRAYILLRYFVDPCLTLAGSLLREQEPFRLFEKGAQFNGLCIPLKSGLDMRQVNDLLLAEHNDAKPMYGGWWFFAFSLTSFSNYPFPFFVRGDDIRFGIDNRLNIATLNGVCCWGEDFSLKSGPLPLYLDLRNHAIALLTTLDAGRTQFFKVAAKFVMAQLFSYNYASAEACIMALEDVFKGPGFFEENLDTSRIRKKIGDLMPLERLEPKTRAEYPVAYKKNRDSSLRAALRWISLNGFLLPSFLLKKRMVFQHKNFRAPLREVFPHVAVYYEHEPSGMAYVVYHDKARFFSIFFRFLRVCAFYAVGFKRVKSAYAKEWPRMTSEGFWRKVLAPNYQNG